ncbi:MAG TPA: hypothetical protein ENK91_03540 [Bacteroidetes bacterium]|nr:hypothetical protein [Bacteroidota bacterium]
MAPKDNIKEILKNPDSNQVLKVLGEKLEFADFELISETRILIQVENFLNKIYRHIKKDGKYENITERQMKSLKKMIAEAKTLNYYLNKEKPTPEHFEMAQNLGEKMVQFSGKLKSIAIPLAFIAQGVVDKLLN